MSPEPDFQKAVYQALTSSSALAAAMGGTVRAYDQVPTNATFPYIQFSESQVLDDGNTCDEFAYQVFATIHVWSRDVGLVEAKKISAAVQGVLRQIFPVPNFQIDVAQFQTSQHFKDADGLSAHGVNVFRYLMTTST